MMLVLPLARPGKVDCPRDWLPSFHQLFAPGCFLVGAAALAGKNLQVWGGIACMHACVMMKEQNAKLQALKMSHAQSKASRNLTQSKASTSAIHSMVFGGSNLHWPMCRLGVQVDALSASALSRRNPEQSLSGHPSSLFLQRHSAHWSNHCPDCAYSYMIHRMCWYAWYGSWIPTHTTHLVKVASTR